MGVTATVPILPGAAVNQERSRESYPWGRAGESDPVDPDVAFVERRDGTVWTSRSDTPTLRWRSANRAPYVPARRGGPASLTPYGPSG